MISMRTPSTIDRGFIGGVMISMRTPSTIDRGFIGGVMISMCTPNTIDREFEPRLGKFKNYDIGVCCFFAKHACAALRSN
jgi:hypothetical protein